MKRLILFTIMLANVASSSYAQEFRLGGSVTEFTLRDTDGHSVSSSKLKGPVTVVMFFSTRCPISNAFNYRRNVLHNDFRGRVKFIAVDPNANESLEEIRGYARAVGFDFPVYKDTDNIVADRFGVQITTDTYVIDSSGVIRYRGYLEDSPNPTRAKNRSLRMAIEEVLAGKAVTTPDTKALGCAIRRVQSSRE